MWVNFDITVGANLWVSFNLEVSKIRFNFDLVILKNEVQIVREKTDFEGKKNEKK